MNKTEGTVGEQRLGAGGKLSRPRGAGGGLYTKQLRHRPTLAAIVT